MTSHPARPRHRRAAPHHRRWGSLLLAAATAIVVSLTIAPPADAASASVLGSDGDRATLQQQVGVPLASHAYGTLNGPVLNARLVNFQSNVSWRTVANAAPGSVAYNNVVRWAHGVQSNGHPTMLTFNHEPEAHASAWLGSSGDFVAAWQHVVNIFRAQGVTNVEWVWNMTANAFFVRPSDRRYANYWYPGDAYVTSVGIDGDNYYNCGPGSGTWRSMSTIMAPGVAFAVAHHKKVVLPETATTADPSNSARKAAWITDAHAYLRANAAVFSGVFYWNDKHVGVGGCNFRISTPAEIAAFSALAHDPLFSGK